MKYFILLLNILSFTTVISAARDPYRLVAVSDSIVAEALYNRIRKASPDTEPPREIDTDTKSRICYHITNNPSFVSAWQERQAFIHKVYKTLIFKNPELFLSLYEISPSADLVYKNRIKPIDVYDSDAAETTVRDYAFQCLTTVVDEESSSSDEDEDETHIRASFVSKEYNVSDDPTKSYVAGRFMFYHAKKENDRLEIFFLGEEPAESLSSPGEEVERLYLESKKSIKLEEIADDNVKGPICHLNPEERLRLCTIVLSSPFFDGELNFIPRYKYIDQERCFKMQISFQDEQLKLETVGKLYEDWMIKCIPEQRYATFQAEYFISRVHNSEDKAFVYRWDKNSKIVIENLFGNVRFKI